MTRGFPTRILEAEIVGVAEAIANLTELGAVDPVVKATLTLSESGFVSVSNAVAFGEIKDDSISGGDFFEKNPYTIYLDTRENQGSLCRELLSRRDFHRISRKYTTQRDQICLHHRIDIL